MAQKEIVFGELRSSINSQYTAPTSLADSINPWVFTFDGLSKVDYAVVTEHYSTYTYTFDSIHYPHLFSISGNTVSFTHGYDGLTWTVVATAIELE